MVNTNFTVTAEGNASSGATTLNGAIKSIDIGGANAATNTHYTITFANGIALNDSTDADLLAINLSAGSSLTINGGNFFLNGENVQRGFFVYSGAVTINNLTIENTVAHGGSGADSGGGGAGLGGGLFVASAGSAILDNVSFNASEAVGGAGGAFQFGSGIDSNNGFAGGGGGMGGNGGSGQIDYTQFGFAFSGGGGGGGLGLGVNGGNAYGGTGAAGIVPGAAGGAASATGQAGGASGGGGGGGGHFYRYYSSGSYITMATDGGGGGGGIGAGVGSRLNGGFGGGGGGAAGTSAVGGEGGFGGGGGEGIVGGQGGFGGGGGGGGQRGAGAGGFGGGKGADAPVSQGNPSDWVGAGGGGLGAGGDIFVQQGGSLTIEGGTLSGGYVAGGGPGDPNNSMGGTGGAYYGSGIFIQGNNQTITFAPTSGQTTTISDVIADMTGSHDASGQTGQGNVAINGGGTVVFSAANTYTGTTTISAGSTLELANASGAGTGEIVFQSGSADTLRIDGTTMPTNMIAGFANGDVIDLHGVAYTAGATVNYWSNTETLLVTTASGAEHLKLASVPNGVEVISDGASGTPGTEIENGPAGTATVGASGTVTYTSGGSAVALDTGATVSDSSGVGITSATVTIATGYESGDTLNFVTQNGITGSYSAGVLTLTGDATAGQYQTALDSITYSFSPSNGDPTNGGSDASRSIDWVVINASGNSNTANSTVDMTAPAPVVAAGATATFHGGGSPTMLDQGLTVTNSVGTDLSGATVTISSGLIDGDTLNFTTQNGISGSYSGGVLTLTGDATAGQYQAALDSITYSFGVANGDPTNGAAEDSRTISWQVTGSGNGNSSAVTSTLNVVHTAPVVTAGGSIVYTPGDSPTALDSGLLLTNIDSGADLLGATIQIEGGDYTIDGNILSAITAGTNITATYNPSNEKLSLSGSDTFANYQSVLDSIAFSSTNATPTNVTIDWVVKDAASQSVTANSTVAVAFPPSVSASAAASDAVQGGAAITALSDVSVGTIGGLSLTSATISLGASFQTGDVLAINGSTSGTINNGGNGTIAYQYNAGTGVMTLTGSDNAADYQSAVSAITYQDTGTDSSTGSHPTRELAVTVNQGSLSDAATAQLTIARAPVAATGSYVVFENSVLTENAANGVLVGATNLDGDTLTVSGVANPGNGTLTLNSDGSFTYTPFANYSGTDTFTFKAVDSSDGLDSGVTTVDVLVDSAPTVSSLTAAAASTANFSTAHTVTFTIDVGKDVTVANGTTLSLSDGGTATYVSGSGTETLTFSYSATDAPGALIVDNVSAGSMADSYGNPLAISNASVTGYSVAVSDTAANVAANFASLDSAVSYISSITLTDGGTPTLDLNASEVVGDQALIGKIAGSYNLIVDDSVADVVANFASLYNDVSEIQYVEFTDPGTPLFYLTASVFLNDHALVAKISGAHYMVIYDTAANVQANFDALEGYAAHITSIALSDIATPTLTLTQTQVTNDASLFPKMHYAYDLMVTGVTAEAYGSYESVYAASNTLQSTTDFNTSGTESITAYVSGLTLTGDSATDTFLLESVPSVTVTGGTGNDIFFFGSGFSSADSLTGGSGTNTLELDANYTSPLTITSAMMSNVQAIDLVTGHSFDLVLGAGLVTTGETLTVSAASLVSGNALTIDGSALTAGSLIVNAGAGIDTLTGGAGTNSFNMTGNLTAADAINGGSGTTTVNLNGDYSAGVMFNATTMVNVDTLYLAAGNSYNLTLASDTVTSGQSMTIQGDGLASGNNMTINGSAVTAGSLTINGGAGTNSLIGGGGNDTIKAGSGTDFLEGGLGADKLYAGSGADTFAYNSASESASTGYDVINGFNTSLDSIDLLGTLTGVTTINSAVMTGHLATSSFDANLTTVLGASQLSAHGAVLFTPSTGGLSGNTFLIIDEHGAAGYSAGQDLVIELTGAVNLSSFGLSNFETGA